ncbi:MCE family protein [Actinophytocola algeriensis]|uniref:Phospholipid/cholesterol/gamma-HCH transport system substrate-binding protein n=1 Tax=Actinophytocola algeriensis TaxID=1768010 RepID=A0A7W7PZM5_9PSEU|nr:MCE family protein [Actinophytocola algeriensis]MBB4904133.1 phospholipid/cholesterol/gamma-HCH transport system substrate-binding protein [Actinophytocola algeriensis]MBE1477010.1 phospholipid/cholesterol/gamma-HCH transport system substrate-binding protein [Actinophytocola algeriensis]
MRHFAGPLIKMTVFAVVTVTLTALLGLTIANTTLGDTSGYVARFTDATGLNEGDDIRMSGVRIGQITDISVVDDRWADVRFDVEASRRLPKSVTATIKYRNLIGQRYIALAIGSGDTNAVLRPGDLIPLDRTQPALNLTQLFNGFQPLFQALQPDQVNKLAGELIQVLQGEGGTIDSVLAHTASLASTVASKDKVIGQVIDNLNTVLTTVNERTTEVSGLIDQLQQLASGLAAQRQPIGDAISALGDLTQSTAGLLSSARPPIKEDIAALGRLAGNLADHGDTVDKFLAGLPHKVQTISRVSSYGGWYNYYLCSMSGRVGVSDLGISVDLPLLPVPGTPPAERCQ